MGSHFPPLWLHQFLSYWPLLIFFMFEIIFICHWIWDVPFLVLSWLFVCLWIKLDWFFCYMVLYFFDKLLHLFIFILSLHFKIIPEAVLPMWSYFGGSWDCNHFSRCIVSYACICVGAIHVSVWICCWGWGFSGIFPLSPHFNNSYQTFCFLNAAGFDWEGPPLLLGSSTAGFPYCWLSTVAWIWLMLWW